MGSVKDALVGALRRRGKRLYGRLCRKTKRHQNRPEIAIYAEMVEDNQKARDCYKAGKFWASINEEFADFLWAGALKNLRNEYLNRRFAGPYPGNRQVWNALLWLYYQTLQKIDTLGFLKTGVEPSIGGDADQELIDGRPMSLDFLQSVEEAYQLQRAWSSVELAGSPQLIVELGAGYGRLAYVCRRMFPDCTYVVLDLPEALICSSYWLNLALPGEVVPYRESRQVTHFTREILLSRKVWTLGAQQIERITPKSVDAFANIYSFAEMPPSVIENYFSQIDRVTRGVFYSKQRKFENNVVDKVQISAKTYPVKPHWRELFEQTSTLYESFFEMAYKIGEIA